MLMEKLKFKEGKQNTEQMIIQTLFLLGKIRRQSRNITYCLTEHSIEVSSHQGFYCRWKQKQAGEEWQRNRPFTYYPRAEEQIIEIVKAEVIKPNQALKLKATQTFIDKNGKERRAGQEWLIRTTGSYLPDTFERVSEVVRGVVLTDKVCVHLRALNEFTDVYGIKRKPGNERIVTNKQAQAHITDDYEQLVAVEQAITLGSRNYCIILNPYNPKFQQNDWGIQVLIKGDTAFFLQPGEELLGGKIEDIVILGEEEDLLVQVIYEMMDNSEKLVRDGSLESQENTFKIKVIEKEEPFLQTQEIKSSFWTRSCNAWI